MMSDKSWLISAWNAKVSTSAVILPVLMRSVCRQKKCSEYYIKLICWNWNMQCGVCNDIVILVPVCGVVVECVVWVHGGAVRCCHREWCVVNWSATPKTSTCFSRKIQENRKLTERTQKTHVLVDQSNRWVKVFQLVTNCKLLWLQHVFKVLVIFQSGSQE